MPSGIQIEDGLIREAFEDAMQELDDIELVENKLEVKENIKKSWQDILNLLFKRLPKLCTFCREGLIGSQIQATSGVPRNEK